ncbi:HNH endonuclease signature motif containing protein [Rhodococcus sp. X156]|uniref:HNH endonuclease signature motif containing protein n=1 Tax=Rhodococcus sp. X156 TaxID=2499145 RepID=UPI0013E3E297|nr:HNH endonuclease signature motif containing protein [Rhodococcus sp. X156]
MTRLAFARGELDFTRVRAIADRTTVLEESVAAAAEARILEVALRPGRELTRARLVAALDRIVAEVDPDGVRERRRRAHHDRDLQVRADTDGLASVWGLLPAVDGAVLDSRLGQMAQSVCSADPRSLAQRRADALTALALGADHLACTCTDPGCPCAPQAPATPQVLLQVSIDAATLAGATDLPGALAGLGVLDADVVRTLAADATWQRLLTHRGTIIAADPPTPAGAVAHAAAVHRYTPGAALARLVRARDGHCRFPGCAVPAARCDLDHVEPFHHSNPAAGGLTVATNLQCLCRWHHRLKTHGDWTVQPQRGAVMRWTSPTGTTHDTVPGDPHHLPPPSEDHLTGAERHDFLHHVPTHHDIDGDNTDGDDHNRGQATHPAAHHLVTASADPPPF